MGGVLLVDVGVDDGGNVRGARGRRLPTLAAMQGILRICRRRRRAHAASRNRASAPKRSNLTQEIALAAVHIEPVRNVTGALRRRSANGEPQ
jgi:hypothetical protein